MSQQQQQQQQHAFDDAVHDDTPPRYSWHRTLCSKNLQLDERGMVARRIASYHRAMAYIAAPLAYGQITIGRTIAMGYKVVLTIIEVARSWVGRFVPGFTTSNPADGKSGKGIETFPNTLFWTFDSRRLDLRYSPTWCKKFDLTCPHHVGDMVGISFTPHDNKVHVEFNNIVACSTPAPSGWLQQFNANQQRIFLVVDVYGQTKAVRLSPTQPLLTWTPTTHHMYPMQIRQAIKTLMILAMPSRDGYSRFDDRGLNMLYLLPNELLFMIFQMLVVAAAR
jgi:hypothetical protein